MGVRRSFICKCKCSLGDKLQSPSTPPQHFVFFCFLKIGRTRELLVGWRFVLAPAAGTKLFNCPRKLFLCYMYTRRQISAASVIRPTRVIVSEFFSPRRQLFPCSRCLGEEISMNLTRGRNYYTHSPDCENIFKLVFVLYIHISIDNISCDCLS
jgi:hypothetical protein